MCRCCQSCWEDIYWNCFEEKFCYDESIANYNADDDEEYMASEKKNGVIVPTQSIVNNNFPICNQPLGRGTSAVSSKIHEEDYRREIQTNVPILAPEILQVFQNSQIFQEHQPKLARIATKPYLSPGVHGTPSSARASTAKRETDEEKLIKRLEVTPEPHSSSSSTSSLEHEPTDKKIKFTIAPDSSPETKRSASPKVFEAILEEDGDKDEVILRPRLPEHFPENAMLKLPLLKKPLRNVHSVPYFSVRTASETDIFSISGSESFSRISMTPEVPSISYSNLPKNYEDTPTVEGYKASVSLYSIQAANEARASHTDYSMPRYFRRSQLHAQSSDNLSTGDLHKDEHTTPKRYEKSHRLKVLRGNLPPLLIHTVRSKKDDGKQVD